MTVRINYSQHRIPLPNDHNHAYRSKTAALLQIRFAKCKAIIRGGNWPRDSYGQGWLSVKYSLSFICSLYRKSTCSRHCVQTCTERQVWQRNWTGFVILTPLNNCSCEAKRKLLSRWRPRIILWRQYAGQQLFNTRPKDNNIASSEVSSNHFRLSLSPNTQLLHPFQTEVFLFQILLTYIIFVIFSKWEKAQPLLCNIN